MPQATEEQRKEWGTDGGCGEEKAMAYLEGKGYKEFKNGVWLLPSPDHVATKEENGAMCFLIDEWDHAGWVKTKEELQEVDIKNTTKETSKGEDQF
jgi:hypothetical protein